MTVFRLARLRNLGAPTWVRPHTNSTARRIVSRESGGRRQLDWRLPRRRLEHHGAARLYPQHIKRYGAVYTVWASS